MSSPPSTLLCHYRYDPLDRLINHTRAEAPTQQRFYCKSRLATEIQGAMQHSIIQHGDLLLAQQQRLGDEVSATLLATDLQRSVLQTLEKNNQRQAIAYSPYGHRRAESGLTRLLGFNGERPDPVTGHYLLGNGYRAFNPVLMRFNSPDKLSPFGKGGVNSYMYCLGNPINMHDSNGHTPSSAIVTTITDWTHRLTIAITKLLSPSTLKYAIRQKIEDQRNSIFANDLMEAHKTPQNSRIERSLDLQYEAAKVVKDFGIEFNHMPARIRTIINETPMSNETLNVLNHIHEHIRHSPPTPNANSTYYSFVLDNASRFGHNLPQNNAPPVRQSPTAARRYKNKLALINETNVTMVEIRDLFREY